MDEVQITAHIQNLSRYVTHRPSGVTLSFPTTTEAVQACLSAIGVDGLRCEEIIITQYSISVPELRPVLGEYASIDELNFLACRIQEMSPDDRIKFAATVKHGEYGCQLKDVINLTYNLSCYDLYPEIKSYEDYGRYMVETRRDFDLPQQAGFYFDYAAYGEDTVINEGGDLTPYGYICNNGSHFQDVYDGQNIPEEYRVFQYPMQAKAKQSHSKQPPKPPAR